MHGKILIKDLDSKNKPRERLLDKGSEALSDIELLAIIIGSGGKNMSAMDLSASLLKNYKTLQNLFESDITKLTEIQYIGRSKAASIISVGELAKRAYLTREPAAKVIKNPEMAFKVVKKDLFGKKQEYLYLISLDSRKKFISKDLICIGSINETLIPVREIVRKAILKNALHVILAHNHPSNDPTPSNEDILVTEKVAKACMISGIVFLDHIITANNKYVSIKSLDLFDSNKFINERG